MRSKIIGVGFLFGQIVLAGCNEDKPPVQATVCNTQTLVGCTDKEIKRIKLHGTVDDLETSTVRFIAPKKNSTTQNQEGKNK